MMGRDNKLVEINGVIIKVSLLLCLVLGPVTALQARLYHLEPPIIQ